MSSNLTAIKSYWDQQSTRVAGSRFGSHSDPNITDLETWYVLNYAIKRYNPRSLLDVGCGKGVRTRLFSKYVNGTTLGIDYSEGMIKLASKLENRKLKFLCADILSDPSIPTTPDMIISCRCLINLGSHENVLRALRFFHRILPDNGHLVLCECSEQGHRSLNRLRKSLGLKGIKTVWHNINLDEELVMSRLKGMFEFSDLSRLGVYYLLTRVLHPSYVAPREPDPTAEINSLSANIQKKVGIGVAEDYGRQFCIVCTKKRIR